MIKKKFYFSKLSTCIEGLQVALLPFEWQHTLITVVPSNVISVADLCDAPTPYLIGLLKSKSNSTRILPQLNNKLHVIYALTYISHLTKSLFFL